MIAALYRLGLTWADVHNMTLDLRRAIERANAALIESFTKGA